MTTRAQSTSVPRGALMMVGGLVGTTLLATAAFRIADVPPTASPVLERQAAHVAPIRSQTLSFADMAGGGVRIDRVGGPSTIIHPGDQSGFVRGVMRGLARDRRMRGMGSAPPFTLTLWANGGLSLTDTATGRIIELNGFGLDNRATFAKLLEPVS